MKFVSAVFALIAGFVCWGLVLALSGGVSPLGKVGQPEAVLFYSPIVLFALPLATIALVRASPLLGVWILALAPVLGFWNFGFIVSSNLKGSSKSVDYASQAQTAALVWLALFLVILLFIVQDVRRRKQEQQEKSRDD